VAFQKDTKHIQKLVYDMGRTEPGLVAFYISSGNRSGQFFDTHSPHRASKQI